MENEGKGIISWHEVKARYISFLPVEEMIWRFSRVSVTDGEKTDSFPIAKRLYGSEAWFNSCVFQS